MSLFNPDFSKDLKRAKVVGVVENVYFFNPSKGGKRYREYDPYNLILTDSALFGENLSTLEESRIMVSPFVGVVKKGAQFDEFQFSKYLNSGTMGRFMDEKQGKIDIMVDYGRVKELTINHNCKLREYKMPDEEKAPQPDLELSVSSVEVRFGMSNDMIFIVNDAVLDQIDRILSNTSMYKKIVTRSC